MRRGRDREKQVPPNQKDAEPGSVYRTRRSVASGFARGSFFPPLLRASEALSPPGTGRPPKPDAEQQKAAQVRRRPPPVRSLCQAEGSRQVQESVGGEPGRLPGPDPQVPRPEGTLRQARADGCAFRNPKSTRRFMGRQDRVPQNSRARQTSSTGRASRTISRDPVHTATKAAGLRPGPDVLAPEGRFFGSRSGQPERADLTDPVRLGGKAGGLEVQDREGGRAPKFAQLPQAQVPGPWVGTFPNRSPPDRVQVSVSYHFASTTARMSASMADTL